MVTVTIIFHDIDDLEEFIREDKHEYKRITAKIEGGLKTYTVRYRSGKTQ